MLLCWKSYCHCKWCKLGSSYGDNIYSESFWTFI